MSSDTSCPHHPLGQCQRARVRRGKKWKIQPCPACRRGKGWYTLSTVPGDLPGALGRGSGSHSRQESDHEMTTCRTSPRSCPGVTQQLRSYVCQARACRGGERPPPLSVFMPVLASLPGESQWVGPQPTTGTRGSKGTECLCVVAGLSPLKEV